MRRVPPAWRLDEVAFAGRENLDPDHVARYDTKEDAGAAEEVELLEHRGVLGASSTVVDLGAGTGQTSPMNMRTHPRTSSPAATRCTTSRTSGKRSR